MTDRLNEFIKYLNVSVRSFEQIISASDGMIRRAINNNTDIQSKWITKIADNYPQLNIYWLLTGKGEMLKTDTCNNVSQPPPAPPDSNAPHECIYKELLKEKEAENRALNREIGALGNKIEQLQEAAKKSAVPYKQELVSPLMAAEPEAAYIKAQQKIPTE